MPTTEIYTLSLHDALPIYYNRKIKQMLDEVRFKPAVRPDGTTVRDTAFVTAEVPGLS